jgi:hypothetical protein
MQVVDQTTFLNKLSWSLPWLVRYPFWRANELTRRITENVDGPAHLIFVVANHYEPAWNENGALPWSAQIPRVDKWMDLARRIGEAVHDCDDTPFRHTNFYPAERYHPALLERLAQLQAEGLGEVEIHLHHGVDQPDTAANLKQTLKDFRDTLAEEHRLLSREDENGPPMYAFVHGNLALANSAGGRCCGVDSEMQILADTGCYADFTLPAAPEQPQVPRINAIYQCGRPLSEPVPHRKGPRLRVGGPTTLPVMFTGPLVFNWQRRVHGLPVPRLDDGVLAANYPLEINRLRRWSSARINISGKPEWIFIKLYCHGFFTQDQDQMIGEATRRFWDQVLELAARSKQFQVHFATARECFNIAMAAVDGRDGEPGLYRDYRLRPIMQFRARRETVLEYS